MEEELSYSRRAFVKILFVIFAGILGFTIFIYSRKFSIDEAINKSLKTLEQLLNEIKKEIDPIIEEDLDNWLNEKLDKNIDIFLDWYYSRGGEITILLYLALKKEVDIFENEYLRERYNELQTKFNGIIFRGILDRTSLELIRLYDEKLELYKEETLGIFKKVEDIEINRVNNLLKQLKINTLNKVNLSFGIYILLFSTLARRLTTRLLKAFIQRTGEKISLKFSLSKLLSLVDAVCVGFAPICMGALNVSLDIIFRRIDEFLDREDLRVEIKNIILNNIDEIREEAKEIIFLKIDETNSYIYKLAKENFKNIYN